MIVCDSLALTYMCVCVLLNFLDSLFLFASVLQVGQILQRFSNDEYHSTPHRVLRPAVPAPARTTLSFFFRPDINFKLEVPEVLRRPNDAGGVYATCTVQEHMGLRRVGSDGSSLKLTSNILKDGSWVGRRFARGTSCRSRDA